MNTKLTLDIMNLPIEVEVTSVYYGHPASYYEPAEEAEIEWDLVEDQEYYEFISWALENTTSSYLVDFIEATIWDAIGDPDE